MPGPNLTDLTVNAVLTNISVAYANEVEGFAHHRVFPIIPMDEEQGFYFEFERADMFRIDTQRRSPGGRSARKKFNLNQKTIQLEQYSLEAELPDEHRTTKDSPLADDSATTEVLTHDMLMKRELDWVNTYLNTSSNPWTVSVQAGTTDFVKWDAASPTIIADVKSWKRLVKLECGRNPNVMTMAEDVWNVVSEDPDIVDRIKHTSSEPVSIELVARLFEIDELIVMSAIQNTAQEDVAATFTGADFVSEKIGFFHRPKSPGKRTLSAGYTYSWTPFDSVRADVGNSGGAAIFQYRDEEHEQDIFRGKMYMQQALVSPHAGMIANDVIT